MVSQRRERSGYGPWILRDHIDRDEIPADVKRGYYHIDGSWYEYPKAFPAALFDPDGFIVIRSESDLDRNDRITGRLKLRVKNSIKDLPTYVRCSHSHMNLL